jgi:hypothetical protein
VIPEKVGWEKRKKETRPGDGVLRFSHGDWREIRGKGREGAARKAKATFS